MDEEMRKRLERGDDPEEVVAWLIEQGTPEGTARLKVTVELADIRGDDLEKVFP